MHTAAESVLCLFCVNTYRPELWSSRNVLFGSAFIPLCLDCDFIILSLGILSHPAQQTCSFHSCLLQLDWLHGCCVSGCVEIHADVFLDILDLENQRLVGSSISAFLMKLLQ